MTKVRIQTQAGKPWFVWWNGTRMHFRTHVREEHRQLGNDEYTDGMIELMARRLLRLAGQVVQQVGVGGQVLHIVLTSDGTRVRAFSGCNRFTGCEQKEGQLHFRSLASTRMACREGMELEQKFLELLTRTTRFTNSGDILALYSGAVALP